MTSTDVWAVVLVKPFRLAKQRLAGVLDAGERAELARVMLADVLTAVEGCDGLAGVIVVTADHVAAAAARRHGAFVLMETAAVGMNAAVTRAVRSLTSRADAGIVIVPADVPHVSPADIAEMIALIERAPAVALVRSSDGGTNLLGCRPSGVIAPSFGPDSFNAHCVAAVRKGITPTVFLAPHLSLDIDRREDLDAFVSRPPSTRTHAYLSRPNIQARLAARPSGPASGFSAGYEGAQP